MKSLLLSLCTVLLLCSCSSDDDETVVQLPLTRETLAGRYDVNLYAIQDVEVTQVNGADIVTTTSITGGVFQDLNYTFNLDGTYSFSGQFVENRTVEVTGTPPRGTESIVTITDSGTYEISATGTNIELSESRGVDDTFRVAVFDGLNLTLTRNERDGQNTFNQVIQLRKI